MERVIQNALLNVCSEIFNEKALNKKIIVKKKATYTARITGESAPARGKYFKIKSILMNIYSNIWMINGADIRFFSSFMS